MNLIGHYCCAQSGSATLRIGSVLPDLVPLYRRKVRPHHLDKLWRERCATLEGACELLAGMKFHYRVDAEFHKHSLFTGTEAALSAALRGASDTPGLKRFLPTHVLTEMFLDHLLLRQAPGISDAFYGDLQGCAPLLGEFVAEHPQAERESFLGFLNRILADRFVEDYRTDEGILYRMNRILRYCGQRGLEPGEEEAVRGVFEIRQETIAPVLESFVGAWRGRLAESLPPPKDSSLRRSA
jgi:hypothetical protein